VSAEFEGLKAIVTGGASGIGATTVDHLLARGCAVAVLDLAPEGAAPGAVAIQCDVSETKSVNAAVDRAARLLGGIDILVNNAGIGSSSSPRPVVDFDDEFWNKTLALNLTAPYKLSKAVLPIMLEKKWGRIINIASINGKLPALHGAAYTASKHGLLGLTRTLALEVARDGITVNAICPGPVKTEMNERRVEYDAKRLGLSMAELESRLTPIGRRLEPEEIVPMALLLALDESAAITGQAFNVDGGVAT
jgi:NAD(P)-dependent dehydrogenase (short-subunit alcohol dehydrogenase family)